MLVLPWPLMPTNPRHRSRKRLRARTDGLLYAQKIDDNKSVPPVRGAPPTYHIGARIRGHPSGIQQVQFWLDADITVADRKTLHSSFIHIGGAFPQELRISEGLAG